MRVHERIVQVQQTLRNESALLAPLVGKILAGSISEEEITAANEEAERTVVRLHLELPTHYPAED